MGKKSRRSRSPPSVAGASRSSNGPKCNLLQAGLAADATEAHRAEIQAEKDAAEARRAALQAESNAITEQMRSLVPDSTRFPTSGTARTGEAKDDSSSASSHKSRSPPHVATGSGTALNGASWELAAAAVSTDNRRHNEKTSVRHSTPHVKNTYPSCPHPMRTPHQVPCPKPSTVVVSLEVRGEGRSCFEAGKCWVHDIITSYERQLAEAMAKADGGNVVVTRLSIRNLPVSESGARILHDWLIKSNVASTVECLDLEGIFTGMDHHKGDGIRSSASTSTEPKKGFLILQTIFKAFALYNKLTHLIIPRNAIGDDVIAVLGILGGCPLEALNLHDNGLSPNCVEILLTGFVHAVGNTITSIDLVGKQMICPRNGDEGPNDLPPPSVEQMITSFPRLTCFEIATKAHDVTCNRIAMALSEHPNLAQMKRLELRDFAFTEKDAGSDLLLNVIRKGRSFKSISLADISILDEDENPQDLKPFVDGILRNLAQSNAPIEELVLNGFDIEEVSSDASSPWAKFFKANRGKNLRLDISDNIMGYKGVANVIRHASRNRVRLDLIAEFCGLDGDDAMKYFGRVKDEIQELGTTVCVGDNMDLEESELDEVLKLVGEKHLLLDPSEKPPRWLDLAGYDPDIVNLSGSPPLPPSHQNGHSSNSLIHGCGGGSDISESFSGSDEYSSRKRGLDMSCSGGSNNSDPFSLAAGREQVTARDGNSGLGTEKDIGSTFIPRGAKKARFTSNPPNVAEGNVQPRPDVRELIRNPSDMVTTMLTNIGFSDLGDQRFIKQTLRLQTAGDANRMSLDDWDHTLNTSEISKKFQDKDKEWRLILLAIDHLQSNAAVTTRMTVDDLMNHQQHRADIAEMTMQRKAIAAAGGIANDNGAMGSGRQFLPPSSTRKSPPQYDVIITNGGPNGERRRLELNVAVSHQHKLKQMKDNIATARKTAVSEKQHSLVLLRDRESVKREMLSKTDEFADETRQLSAIQERMSKTEGDIALLDQKASDLEQLIYEQDARKVNADNDLKRAEAIHRIEVHGIENVSLQYVANASGIFNRADAYQLEPKKVDDFSYFAERAGNGMAYKLKVRQFYDRYPDMISISSVDGHESGFPKWLSLIGKGSGKDDIAPHRTIADYISDVFLGIG